MTTGRYERKYETVRFYPTGPPLHLAMLSGEQVVGFEVNRGQALRLEDLEQAAETIQNAPNYGQPTKLLMNKAMRADLKKTFGC